MIVCYLWTKMVDPSHFPWWIVPRGLDLSLNATSPRRPHKCHVFPHLHVLITISLVFSQCMSFPSVSPMDSRNPNYMPFPSDSPTDSGNPNCTSLLSNVGLVKPSVNVDRKKEFPWAVLPGWWFDCWRLKGSIFPSKTWMNTTQAYKTSSWFNNMNDKFFVSKIT